MTSMHSTIHKLEREIAMPRLRVLTLGASLALASALPACSSSSTGSGVAGGGIGSDGGGGSVSDGASGATPNYCGLIGVAEMAQLSAAAVTHLFRTSDGEGCDYLFDNDANALAAGVTLLFITKNAAAAYQSAKQPRTDYVVTDLPGVGDSAVSVASGQGGSGHEVVAIRGTTLLLITGIQDPAGQALSLDAETKIAKTIFARLP